MLQLLQPIWMYTATAMAIPLAIHLWNIRKGKRLKVGSLSLITESVQKKARQIRITEWLLLLLRCLLVLLLALFLSQPVWRRSPAQIGKGWVLVPRESVATVYPSFRHEIDSLLNEGYTFHHFNFPFDEASVSQQVQDASGSDVSYWQRIAQLNGVLPAGWPVYVYTPGGIAGFTGEKPALDIAVTWKTDPAPDLYTRARSDSLPLHISLYYDNRHREDARYLGAALETIRSVLKQNLVVHQTTEPVTSGGQDLVIWLSEEEPAYRDTGALYIRYAAGKTVSENSPLVINRVSGMTNPLLIYRRVLSQNNPHKPLWTDAYGNTILDFDAMNRQLLLYTRFDPGWNGLVWDASFPELISRLLQPEHTNATPQQVDASQLVFAPLANHTKTIAGKEMPVSGFAWWLLVACFAAERWLSSYKRKKDAA
ncbi:BatA domain-containing protein [Sediminibacterium soli]|uniref:BatA domain-containing protein n=1 Tax=Sediminibacterium soli TaxID=2698829 RepID=UPI00137AFBF7|nr:BatA domain-containing protein [Sediminibacterium soli]NCI45212.1 hypothetical protein [Sediminibacterium soli]